MSAAFVALVLAAASLALGIYNAVHAHRRDRRRAAVVPVEAWREALDTLDRLAGEVWDSDGEGWTTAAQASAADAGRQFHRLRERTTDPRLIALSSDLQRKAAELMAQLDEVASAQRVSMTDLIPARALLARRMAGEARKLCRLAYVRLGELETLPGST